MNGPLYAPSLVYGAAAHGVAVAAVREGRGVDDIDSRSIESDEECSGAGRGGNDGRGWRFFQDRPLTTAKVKHATRPAFMIDYSAERMKPGFK